MSSDYLDRNLALDTVRVTEMAALSSSLHMGRGDEIAADQSAVNAMRNFLNNLIFCGFSGCVFFCVGFYLLLWGPRLAPGGPLLGT